MFKFFQRAGHYSLPVECFELRYVRDLRKLCGQFWRCCFSETEADDFKDRQSLSTGCRNHCADGPRCFAFHGGLKAMMGSLLIALDHTGG